MVDTTPENPALSPFPAGDTGSAALTEHALGAEHLAGAIALTRAANWNQREADWLTMLEIGEGWGLSDAAGRLVATALVLPWPRPHPPDAAPFGWISMVLVDPARRRRGHAARLLSRAVATLRERGLVAVLDATPAGREVYRREGFRDTIGFQRWRREAPHAATLRPAASTGSDTAHGTVTLRPIEDRDWPAVERLDAEAFGADRSRLLRALARRLPHAALVAATDGGVLGFVLGRDGHDAAQIGPVVARDAALGLKLLGAALGAIPQPVYVDWPDAHQAMHEWLANAGFAPQRPFTRMVLGANEAPGNATLVLAAAGPELG